MVKSSVVVGLFISTMVVAQSPPPPPARLIGIAGVCESGPVVRDLPSNKLRVRLQYYRPAIWLPVGGQTGVTGYRFELQPAVTGIEAMAYGPVWSAHVPFGFQQTKMPLFAPSSGGMYDTFMTGPCYRAGLLPLLDEGISLNPNAGCEYVPPASLAPPTAMCTTQQLTSGGFRRDQVGIGGGGTCGGPGVVNCDYDPTNHVLRIYADTSMGYKFPSGSTWTRVGPGPPQGFGASTILLWQEWVVEPDPGDGGGGTFPDPGDPASQPSAPTVPPGYAGSKLSEHGLHSWNGVVRPPFPTLSSTPSAPVWNMTFPMSSICAMMGLSGVADVSWTVSFEAWAPYRGLFHSFVTLGVLIWGIGRVWQEFRRQ